MKNEIKWTGIKVGTLIEVKCDGKWEPAFIKLVDPDKKWIRVILVSAPLHENAFWFRHCRLTKPKKRIKTFNIWWKKEGYDLVSALALNQDMDSKDFVELGYCAARGNKDLRSYLKSLVT